MLPIFISCDENYSAHLATTIISAIINCKEPEKLKFIIGDAGLKADTRSTLTSMIEKYGSHVAFVYLDDSKFSGLKIKRYGKSIYFRFYLDELLDDEELVLCLDCDTVVVGDLLDIYGKTSGESFTIAAVENIGRSPYSRLGLKKGDYFNCGLMLINIKQWKEEKIGKRGLEFLLAHPELCAHNEQCAINKVAQGEWYRLPLTWNAQRPAYKILEKRMNEQHRDKNEFLKSIQEPIMVHYMGKNSKPWDAHSLHPLKALYTIYRRKTPWPVKTQKTALHRRIRFYASVQKIFLYEKRKRMSKQLIDIHKNA